MRDTKPLTERLEIKAMMIQMGERIAYGSDSGIMHEAVAALKKLAAERDALLDRLEKAEKALKVAANALSLALSDVDWRKDSPTQPVIHKAYQKAMEASK